MPNAFSVRITGREITYPLTPHAHNTDIAPKIIIGAILLVVSPRNTL